MIEREPRFAHLLQDIWRIVFFILFLGADVGIVLFLPKIQPDWLDGIGRLSSLFIGHIIVVMITRELVPNPPEGSLRVGKGVAYLKWLILRSFGDVANCRLFAGPFGILHGTRFLYLRALGAKLAYNASIHPTVVISLPSLLAVDAGAQLEAGVKIENVVHAMGRVRISPVTISAGALVGAHVTLMPGATLGPNVRVGPGAYVGPDTCVGVGVKIGEGTILAAGVDLGSYVRIGAGAVIAEGVSIGENAKVRAGSVIPPSTRIRAGEIWQGLPARPVFRDNRHDESQVGS